jgi:hypothetical protein
LTVKQSTFPRLPLLVLVIGLTIISVIAFLSFSPPWLSNQGVGNIEQAEEIVNQYLVELGNDFEIEEIMEFSNHFYIIVQEGGTGVNAFELLVDRYTGKISFEPGPNMMWNQKYGHMGRVTNPNASMPIDPHEASLYAQQWLERHYPGAVVEELKVFYGYYTMDVSRNEQIFGMLSVNGFTGEVWYHSWHGDFIRMEDHGE